MRRVQKSCHFACSVVVDDTLYTVSTYHQTGGPYERDKMDDDYFSLESILADNHVRPTLSVPVSPSANCSDL